MALNEMYKSLLGYLNGFIHYDDNILFIVIIYLLLSNVLGSK